jgi:hypothetical protein
MYSNLHRLIDTLLCFLLSFYIAGEGAGFYSFTSDKCMNANSTKNVSTVIVRFFLLLPPLSTKILFYSFRDPAKGCNQ